VIIIDANLLIYASVASMQQHTACRGWLDEQLTGSEAVGLPWQSLTAYLRLVTNRRIFEHPASPAEAWAQVEAWLDCPPVWIPLPGVRHRAVFADLIPHVNHPNLVPDAHLAALAIEHGLALCSADTDFERFPGLRCHNPLAAA
jgi:uncharacterized protein